RQEFPQKRVLFGKRSFLVRMGSGPGRVQNPVVNAWAVVTPQGWETPREGVSSPRLYTDDHGSRDTLPGLSSSASRRWAHRFRPAISRELWPSATACPTWEIPISRPGSHLLLRTIRGTTPTGRSGWNTWLTAWVSPHPLPVWRVARITPGAARRQAAACLTKARPTLAPRSARTRLQHAPEHAAYHDLGRGE